MKHILQVAISLALAITEFGCPTGSAPSKTDDASATDQPSAMRSYEPFIGFYELSLESDAGWHHHSLELEAIVGRTIQGRIVIDRGIGPQARAPMPDETSHLVAFVAKPGESPLSLELGVTTGTFNKQSLEFALWLCPDAGTDRCGDTDGPSLHGSVVVDGQRAQPQAAAASKAEATKEEGRVPWTALPRGDN